MLLREDEDLSGGSALEPQGECGVEGRGQIGGRDDAISSQDATVGSVNGHARLVYEGELAADA